MLATTHHASDGALCQRQSALLTSARTVPMFLPGVLDVTLFDLTAVSDLHLPPPTSGSTRPRASLPVKLFRKINGYNHSFLGSLIDEAF
jgi:hypothetical protein